MALLHDDQDHKNRRCNSTLSALTLTTTDTDAHTPTLTSSTYEGCAQPVDCFGQWGSYTDCVYDENQHTNTRCRTYVVETICP